MGTFNSNGTGGGDWTADGTWTETGQPAADGTDYVVITSGDVVTLPGDTGTGAISIQGELTGNGHTLTLNGSGDTPLMNFDGTITATSTLDLTIEADENNQMDCVGTGTFNDVTIDNSGYTTTLTHPLTCASLTITAGTLDTGSDKALTVTGKTTVAGTLTLNDSVVLLGTTSTSDYGLEMTAGALDMGGADVKTGAVNVSSGTVTMTSATWEVMSAYSSNAWIFVPSSLLPAAYTDRGTLKFTSPLGGNIRTPQGMNNVIFEPSSGTPTWTVVTQSFGCVNLNMVGDTYAGTLDTNDFGLSVTSTLEVDGTASILECGDSALTLGQDDTDSGWGLYNTGGTINGGTGDWTVSSFYHHTGVTTLTDGTITMNGKDTGGAVIQYLGYGTLTHPTNGIIDIADEGGFINITGANLTLYELRVNSSSTHNIVATSTSNTLTLTTLKITDGGINTLHPSKTDAALTVTGTTTLAGTLALNGSTCLFNTGGTAGGIILNSGGHVTADADSTVTLGSIIATTESPVGITLSGTNTINKYYSSGDGFNNRIIHAMEGTVDGATLFTITTTDADKGIAVQDTDCSLTFTPASSTSYFLDDSANIAALTISANATLTTLDGGTNRNLTVTGLVNIGGTLTGNGSAIWMGGLLVGSSGKYSATTETTTITSEDVTTGYAWDVNGTDSFDNNDGTVLFDLPASMDSHIRTGQADGANSFHNLTVLLNAAARTLVLRPNGGSAMTIEGDLTVQEGKFYQYNDNYSLTVTGDVSVESGGELGLASTTGVLTFGSLNIDGSAIFVATQGTTTITSEGAGGGDYALYNQGTFTHNGGTLAIEINTSTRLFMDADNLYNLITGKASGADSNLTYFGGSATTTTVANDLTVLSGRFRGYNANNLLTVTGDVSVTGDLSYDGATAAMEFGSLTIESDGEYHATSGQTKMKGNFANSGTFTNNDGKMYFEGPNSVITGTGLIFYDLDCVDGGSGWTSFKNDFTVENELDIQDWKGLQLKCVDNTVTLTMGTATAQGEITMLGAYTQIQGDNNTVNVATITGVNSLYPAIITQSAGTTGKFFTDNKCQLANVNVVNSFVTLGNTSTLTLTGDCEFDAVTIAANDTLDIGGQRIEFSGEFRNNGAMDSTGGGLMICHSDLIQTGVAEYIHDGDVNVIAYGGIGNDYSLGAGNTPSGPWATNLMINDDVTSNAHFGDAYGRFSPENIIVGNGTFTMANSASYATDITVANGGTLVPPTGNTMTCSGNFNLGGGLIGKSAYDFNGAASGGGYIDCTANAALEDIFDGGGTVEAWIRIDGDAGTASGMRPFSKDKWFVSVDNDASGDVYKLRLYQFFSGDNGVWSSTNTVLSKDKWHHIAITYNNGATTNDPLLYVDGKQVAITESGTPTGTFDADGSDELYLGNRGDGARTFNGVIGMARIWSDIRDVDELRTNMFDNFANMTTPEKVGLVAMYQFDEGTSTDLENVANAGTADGTITANSSDWAGAGTFTQGTSTVDLTGTGELILKGTVGFYNLKCAAATKTTTTRGLGSITIGIKNNIYVGDGTLTRTGGSPSWRFAYDTTDGSSQTLGGTVVSGATYPVDLHNTYVNYYHDTTLVKEVKWNYFIGTRGCTFSANQESTGYTSWNGGSATYDYGNYTLKADHAKFGGSSGTVNFDAGKLWLTSTSGLSASTASDTFTCGPGGTVSGSSAATTFKSQNNWSVVGNIENLNVTNEELSVLGNVTNCTGEIHRWNPTIDTAQMLDADTADDRDVRLGSDLDRNTELVT